MEKTTCHGKNYGAIGKLWYYRKKLWNVDLLWKKLGYYGKNYSTIESYSKLVIVYYSIVYIFIELLHVHLFKISIINI